MAFTNNLYTVNSKKHTAIAQPCTQLLTITLAKTQKILHQHRHDHKHNRHQVKWAEIALEINDNYLGVGGGLEPVGMAYSNTNLSVISNFY